MPLFEYSCRDCETSYDILHKTSEDTSVIACPSCHSKSYSKKFSTFSASIQSGTGASSQADCQTGACGMPSYSPCAGGACGLN